MYMTLVLVSSVCVIHESDTIDLMNNPNKKTVDETCFDTRISHPPLAMFASNSWPGKNEHVEYPHAPPEAIAAAWRLACW